MMCSRARLAQLVEHPLDVGRVRGSSPLSRTVETENKFKPTEQANFIGIGITILALVVLTFFIDLSSVKTWIEQAGVWGPLVFIILKATTIIIAPLSGSALFPLAGLFFGFWPGVLYVEIGDFLGYTISFHISRIFGQKVVMRLLQNKDNSLIKRVVDHVSTPKGFLQACLTLFAMPELLSYGAGLSRLPYIKFILIITPLSIVASSILVFFGSLLDLSSGSVLISIGIPILGAVVILAGGTIFLKSVMKKKENI